MRNDIHWFDGNGRVRVAQISRVLHDEEYRERDGDTFDYQDYACDLLESLDASYADDIPLVLELLLDRSIDTWCRLSVLTALGNMDPGWKRTAPAVAAVLSDPDYALRDSVAGDLRTVDASQRNAVLPHLVWAARDWHLGTWVTSPFVAFTTLVHLVGIREAVRLLFDNRSGTL